MRFQQAGHKPYALVGGATGAIGDPSGKTAERNMLTWEDIAHNCAGIKSQLARFLDFSETAENGAVLVNNADWFRQFSFLDFIRDAGKHLTVNYMLSKDSVQKRLETGLSFTEFSYQLIQGYDFYYLHKNEGVELQMGGADQWGNITTGGELVRRKAFHEEGKEAAVFAFTCPLITKADGTKFGKSEGGNIWLDAGRTSPFKFYQFWLNLSDADAARMSYTFSFQNVEAIEAAVARHEEAPHLRNLQKDLAAELTILVHGGEALQGALQATGILFGKATLESLQALSERELLEVFEGIPQVTESLESIGDLDLLTFLTETGVFASKGEARKMVTAGGLSINKEKVTSAEAKFSVGQLLHGKYLLLQKGKKDYTLAVFA